MSNYGYDAMDWLIQDSVTAATTTTNNLTYDANGNRLSDNRGAYIYLAASNRLNTAPDGGVTRDAAGNTLSDGSSRSFTYNAAGRLQAATINGTVVASYTYRANVLRARALISATNTVGPGCKPKKKPPKKPKPKCAPGVPGTAVYHYDLAGNLVGETTEIGELITDYVYAGATPSPNSTATGSRIRSPTCTPIT